jgi:hypothetical protein
MLLAELGGRMALPVCFRITLRLRGWGCLLLAVLTAFLVCGRAHALITRVVTEACEAKLAGEFKLSVRQATVLGRTVNYTFVEPTGTYFDVMGNIPGSEKTLFIYFDPEAHPYIWYRGTTIDSSGIPGLYVDNFVGRQHVLPRGLLISIRNLPPDFDAKFDAFLLAFRKRIAITCVSSLCDSLKGLDVTGLLPRRYYTSTGLLKHLFRLAGKGEVDLIALGTDLPELVELIRLDQNFKIVNNSVVLVTLGLLPGLAVTGRMVE